MRDWEAEAYAIADKKFDGHLTLYKFTTGHKMLFGTPSDLNEYRTQLEAIPGCLTKLGAFKDAVLCFDEHARYPSADAVAEAERAFSAFMNDEPHEQFTHD